MRAGFKTERMMFVCRQNTANDEKRALRIMNPYLFPNIKT